MYGLGSKHLWAWCYCALIWSNRASASRSGTNLGVTPGCSKTNRAKRVKIQKQGNKKVSFTALAPDNSGLITRLKDLLLVDNLNEHTWIECSNPAAQSSWILKLDPTTAPCYIPGNALRTISLLKCSSEEDCNQWYNDLQVMKAIASPTPLHLIGLSMNYTSARIKLLLLLLRILEAPSLTIDWADYASNLDKPLSLHIFLPLLEDIPAKMKTRETVFFIFLSPNPKSWKLLFDLIRANYNIKAVDRRGGGLLQPV
ncbi:hypothetical protein NEHOM01_0739 [Nematocida homosporus]|uniref:uncharacterized protein n=1 Tax=Nematocida homosporus TaxID=1912981 RepID=UPI00222095FA|nr:uncharacterized protein NEHOM01_0739 [Nematocida homosporus]KAI5185281.1 hypothetical protein NEHOM01_0739 [Nematocida homosporus]